MFLRCLTALLVVAATLLTWMGALDCRFFRTTNFSFISYPVARSELRSSYGLFLMQGYDADALDSIQQGGGFWQAQSAGACVSFASLQDVVPTKLDSYMWAAIVFGALSIAVSLIMLLCVLLPLCQKPLRIGVLSLCSVFMGLFTIGEFLSMRSNLCYTAATCNLDTSGYFTATAAALWLLLIPLLRFVSSVDAEEQEEQQLPK